MMTIWLGTNAKLLTGFFVGALIGMCVPVALGYVSLNGGIATIISAALGAGITVAGAVWVSNYMAQRSLVQAQVVAAMQVANGLRRWMREAEATGYDIDNYDGPNGPTPTPKVRLSNFPFETTLEAVAQLDSLLAKAAFELIHVKDDLDEEMGFEIEYGDNLAEEIAEISGGLLAKTYLLAASLYDGLCKVVDWPMPARAEHERARMRDKAAKYERDKQARAHADPEMVLDEQSD